MLRAMTFAALDMPEEALAAYREGVEVRERFLIVGQELGQDVLMQQAEKALRERNWLPKEPAKDQPR